MILLLKLRVLTNKMIPLRTSFESTPTLRSSRHSLSNFSGVSLLSMLENYKKGIRHVSLPIQMQAFSSERYKSFSKHSMIGTYPLTFLKIASFSPLSLEELTSRLVLREGTHL